MRFLTMLVWLAIMVLAGMTGHNGLTTRVAAQDATPAVPNPQVAADSERAEQVRETEHARLRALVDADIDAASRLHTDDFQLINPDGYALSKDDYLGGIASGEIDYVVFEPTSAIDVRLYDEVAVIRYQSQIEIVVFGERERVRGWHTDVYENHDGQWQAVWSQMTRIVE